MTADGDVAVGDLEVDERAGGVVYDQLREMIIDGDLAPGTVISQAELARRLGLSRTPVREAVRQLQRDGLLRAEPKRRVRVVDLDPADFELIYASRILYETLALGITFPRLTAADLAALEQALADMREAAGRGDYQGWDVAHDRFHGLLVVHAPAELKRQIAPYYERARRYRRRYESRDPRHWNVGDAAHEAIVEACRAGDERRVVGELARHIAAVSMTHLINFYPGYEPTMLRRALRMVLADPVEAW